MYGIIRFHFITGDGTPYHDSSSVAFKTGMRENETVGSYQKLLQMEL